MAGDKTQHNGDNDGIVGVPKDRNEVGDKVNRKQEIDQEHNQPYPDRSWGCGVGDEAAQEAHYVGYKSYGVSQCGRIRLPGRDPPQ